MRLHYISSSVVPSTKANSIQVMKMCQAFARAGADVTLFCLAPHGADEMPLERVFEHYRVEPAFSIERVSVSRVRRLDRLVYAVALHRAMRRHPAADVVYSRDVISVGMLCALGLLRRKLLLEVHSTPPNAMWGVATRAIFRSRSFARLVTISSALAAEYERRYGRVLFGKITVAHDGADPPASTPFGERAAGAPEAPVTLGYIGSLSPGKGMEMIHALASRLPQRELHVVGGDEATIRSWRERCAGGNVRFHGYVSQQRIPEFMEAFDVVLAPYESRVIVGEGTLDIARWMSPLKIFEYMSAGKAIVASDLPVIREILTDGETALLAKVGDAQDWAAKIERLANDPPLRERLGRSAQRQLLASHTWDHRAKAILADIAR